MVGFHGSTQDLVLLLDKLQGTPAGYTCPEVGHGKLTVHGSGQALICCVEKCKAHAKVDADVIALALASEAADRAGAFAPATVTAVI